MVIPLRHWHRCNPPFLAPESQMVCCIWPAHHLGPSHRKNLRQVWLHTIPICPLVDSAHFRWYLYITNLAVVGLPSLVMQPLLIWIWLLHMICHFWLKNAANSWILMNILSMQCQCGEMERDIRAAGIIIILPFKSFPSFSPFFCLFPQSNKAVQTAAVFPPLHQACVKPVKWVVLNLKL